MVRAPGLASHIKEYFEAGESAKNKEVEDATRQHGPGLVGTDLFCREEAGSYKSAPITAGKPGRRAGSGRGGGGAPRSVKSEGGAAFPGKGFAAAREGQGRSPWVESVHSKDDGSDGYSHPVSVVEGMDIYSGGSVGGGASSFPWERLGGDGGSRSTSAPLSLGDFSGSKQAACLMETLLTAIEKLQGQGALP